MAKAEAQKEDPAAVAARRQIEQQREREKRERQRQQLGGLWSRRDVFGRFGWSIFAAFSGISLLAALRSDEVNVRTGPGTRYPVDWVFKRKFMPVEVIGEFENWRKIRDWQGASGWVHQSLLTGKRSFIIPSKAASLHKTPAASAEVVAKLEPEVMGEIRSCSGDWCRVRVSSVSGWIERTGLWGVYKSEPIN